MTITAIDNAGNIGKSDTYKITIAGDYYFNALMILGTFGASIIVSYIAIYLFWKYYFSKKQLASKDLEDHEVKDYLDLVRKDKAIMDEIKDKNK